MVDLLRSMWLQTAASCAYDNYCVVYKDQSTRIGAVSILIVAVAGEPESSGLGSLPETLAENNISTGTPSKLET